MTPTEKYIHEFDWRYLDNYDCMAIILFGVAMITLVLVVVWSLK
jgi:hypothetical protein